MKKLVLILTGIPLILILVFTIVYILFGQLKIGDKPTVRVQFSGMAMSPTIRNGDLVEIDKAYYKNHPIQRGDIVLYKTNIEGEENLEYVKRIAGLPGDKIHIKGKNLYINGQLFDFPGKGEVLSNDSEIVEQTGFYIRPGYYFLIGDNPMHSIDSRFYGQIKEADILGKASVPIQ